MNANLNITRGHFALSLIHYLSEVTDPKKNEIFVVFREENNAKVLQNIERYYAANPATISHPKGGIIYAMLNKRDECKKHTHFILPVRNNEGQAPLVQSKAVTSHHSEPQGASAIITTKT